MRAALALARRGLGEVWPHPSVACIVAQGRRVVGRARTPAGGQSTAEVLALAQAGEAARGATVYLTLETGGAPGVATLIKAHLGRVVIAMEDPDPRLASKGIEALRRAGIEVTTGLLADAAEELNAGFLRRVIDGRPLVTVKLTTSLDGRIATHAGEGKGIAGAESRAIAHRLRADSDAVMIGSGVALLENSDLTCRLPGLDHRSPVRVVVDGRLRLPLTNAMIAGAAKTPTWIVCRNDNPPQRIAAFLDCGVEVIETVVNAERRVCLKSALRELGRRGLSRVLVEGGSYLIAALLRDRLVDRLAWFHAPLLIGADGVAATAAFGVDRLAQAVRFRPLEVEASGSDVFSYLAVETL